MTSRMASRSAGSNAAAVDFPVLQPVRSLQLLNEQNGNVLRTKSIEMCIENQSNYVWQCILAMRVVFLCMWVSGERGGQSDVQMRRDKRHNQIICMRDRWIRSNRTSPPHSMGGRRAKKKEEGIHRRVRPSALMSCEHYLFLYHFVFVFIVRSQLDHATVIKLEWSALLLYCATVGTKTWRFSHFIFLLLSPTSSSPLSLIRSLLPFKSCCRIHVYVV